MSGQTAIEWAHRSWNPVRGCSRVSKGCEHCYAERQAARMAGPGGAYEGLVEKGPKGPRWTGRVRVVDKDLDAPLRWRKPQRIFVNSMSDLFHEAIGDDTIDRIFAVMALCPQHRFIVLTKRPERMRGYFRRIAAQDPVLDGIACWHCAAGPVLTGVSDAEWEFALSTEMPLPNVILGVSAEDQATTDERIPVLLDTPAACRIASLEPLLGAVDLVRGGWSFLERIKSPTGKRWEKLDGVIVGGESGPGARPLHPFWVDDVRRQCLGAGVPFFFKQWGEWAPIAYGIEKEDGEINRVVNISCDGRKETLIGDGAAEFPHVNLRRVGKKAAGAVLAGREWRGLPQAALVAGEV